MKRDKNKKSTLLRLLVFLFFLFGGHFKGGYKKSFGILLFVKCEYKTKAYPLIHILERKESVGSGICGIRSNIKNILDIYKEVPLGEHILHIDDLIVVNDEEKKRGIVTKTIEYIDSYVPRRSLIKYSGIIYLYEIIHENNFYYFMHFIMRNNNNGVIIILPELFYIDENEFLKTNGLKTNGLDASEKKLGVESLEIFEKRIGLFQEFLLNLKLNQAVYFIRKNEEIQEIYKKYEDKFWMFDLTRNVTVKCDRNKIVYKSRLKNLFYFLTNDNINVNTLFNNEQNAESFLLTKNKTILITVDYNVFNIISDFHINSTSKNAAIITVLKLIQMFSEVFKNETNIHYNILFFFTNYYYGIEQFMKDASTLFKENIDFVLCIDDLNLSDIVIYETKKNQSQNIVDFYKVLEDRVKTHWNKNVSRELHKIKAYSKHLPKTHEYFVLNKLNSFTLSSKRTNATFLNKTLILERNLKAENVKRNSQTLFEALYMYIKEYNTSDVTDEVLKVMERYTNNVLSNDIEITVMHEQLNTYNKYFIYKDDVEKMLNYIQTLLTPLINESNFLIKNYTTHDKKQRFVFQESVTLVFAMAVSYFFHYLHFLFVLLFLSLVYLFVHYYFKPKLEKEHKRKVHKKA